MSTILDLALLAAILGGFALLVVWGSRKLRAALGPEPEVEVEGSGVEPHGPGSIAAQNDWLDVDQDGPADDVAEDAR